MRNLKNIIIGFWLFLAGSLTVLGDVAPKTGNFFLKETDVSLPGGLEPKITRVYNSLKRDRRGMFGYGWSNEYEVYLKAAADGSVLVYSVGDNINNGLLDIFQPDRPTEADIKISVEKMTRTAREIGQISSDAEAADYALRLQKNEGLRRAEWEKFERLNLLSEQQPSMGELFHRTGCWCYSYQFLTRTRDGYLRDYAGGEHGDIFDKNGRLVRMISNTESFINFTRDGEGRLQNIEDNSRRSIKLFYNSRGLVERLESENGQKIEYRYDENDNLIYSKNAQNEVREYKYDKHHNMIAATTPAGKTNVIYYDDAFNYKVKSVSGTAEDDGNLHTYIYQTLEKTPETQRYKVEEKTSGDYSSTRTNEYLVRYDETGLEWTQHEIAIQDGERTETEYDRLGHPLTIKRDGEIVQKNVYNEHGLVLHQEKPEKITNLSYDERSKKVSFVEIISTAGEQRKSWAKYQYNIRSNLIFAEDDQRRHVALKYDEEGRIIRLEDETGKILEFEYNNDSKPTKISLTENGVKNSITVTYKIYEVDKVDSSNGRKISLEVTAFFQKLLDIIRPAGVSLY